MNNDEIKKVIETIEKDFQWGDGGLAFIDYLTKKIKNTEDQDKKEVIDFLLYELDSNTDKKYCSIALHVLSKLNDTSVAKRVYSIFETKKIINGGEWTFSIIELLIKLKYAEPKQLYIDFILKYLDNQYTQVSGYFLLLRFCAIDVDDAIIILSNFLSENLVKDEKIQEIIRVRIGFLVSEFNKYPASKIYTLYLNIKLKNESGADYFKNVVVSHLNDRMSYDCPISWIIEVKTLFGVA